MLELIKQETHFGGKFNDMTDFDIEVAPGVIFDDLQMANEEQFEGKWTVEKVEGKHLKITIPGDEEGLQTVVKVKFFKIGDDKTRVRFIKK